MQTEHGWISYTPGANTHLTDEQRDLVERRIRERGERLGALLGVVEVRVYEYGAEPQVSFREGCQLDVESHPADIAAMVARARDELGRWR